MNTVDGTPAAQDKAPPTIPQFPSLVETVTPIGAVSHDQNYKICYNKPFDTFVTVNALEHPASESAEPARNCPFAAKHPPEL